MRKIAKGPVGKEKKGAWSISNYQEPERFLLARISYGAAELAVFLLAHSPPFFALLVWKAGSLHNKIL